jgi:hypothetical protein
MPSIGNIVVKRIIERKLLPPVSLPIIKGPTFPVVIAPEIVSPPQGIILPGGKGAAHFKEVVQGISQNVIVGGGSVTRTKVSGVVGVSYTQLSYTSMSYTLLGAQVTKSLSDTLTITEPLAVKRVKGRSIFEDAPELTELSSTLDIGRTKARALAQTEAITDLIEGLVTTGVFKELSETVSVSDSVVAVKESKRTLVQSDALDDNVAIILPGVRMTLTETIAVLEDLDFELTHAGGVNITKSLSDSTTISDSQSRALTNVRTLATQTVSIGESLTKEITAKVSFTSSYTDISYTSATRPEKSLTEVVEESHTVRMALTKNRGVPTQTIIITEQLTITIPPPTGDNVLVSEQVIRQVIKARGISQSVTIIG